ncbi:MAG: IclR family transcriptional regulator [Aquificae bacterium]|nr:IclR family transcriptional regulator [Aquificota bacterium]
MMPSSPYLIRNLQLALELLFLVREKPCSFERLQEALKLSRPKLQKLLNFLTEHEWLVYDADENLYRLGLKSFELGSAYLRHLDVTKAARPVLDRLARALGENVYLTTRVAYEVLYIAKSEVERKVRILSRYGRVLPLYASASGKIYLSHFDPRELEDYLKTVKWVRHTRNTKTLNELLNELKKIKKDGYAVNLEEYEEEVVSSAAPVYDSTGAVRYTVTLVAPSYRVKPAELQGRVKELLKEAARELSAKLGGL